MTPHDHHHDPTDEMRSPPTRSAAETAEAPRGGRLRRGVVIFALLGFVWLSVVVVDETELVVLTRFGAPVRSIQQAGLHFKLPVDRARRLEKRVLLLEGAPAELLTADKKNLLVEVAVLWRIAAPVTFLESAGDRFRAEQRLRDLVGSRLAAELGGAELGQLLSTSADEWPLEALLERAADQPESFAALGVEVLDLQLASLGFPEQNLDAVFARMRAERERIAREYRAQGQEAGLGIRAEADLERDRLLAEAERDAAILRGDGEAEAARIYGEAFRRDPELYRFLRSLESYDEILDESTTLVLDADSPILRLLSEGGGR